MTTVEIGEADWETGAAAAVLEPAGGGTAKHFAVPCPVCAGTGAPSGKAERRPPADCRLCFGHGQVSRFTAERYERGIGPAG